MIRRSLVSRLSQGGLGSSLALSLALVVLACGVILFYSSLVLDLPSPEQLPLLLDPPDGIVLQPTRLYDRTGEHIIAELENPAATEREYVPLAPEQPPQLPSVLITATIATADPGFWDHPGFVWQGLRQGEHPTLAQRLVADLLLWDEPAGLRRNIRERLLAVQVTQRYGRLQVLEWYLNSGHYGRLTYGADAAARTYFGKTVASLTLGEAAVLAAAAEAPALNPLDAPQLARERQITVLQTMLRLGLISANEFRQAEGEEIAFATVQPPTDLAPGFTNLVLEQLAERFGPERVRRGGFKVITSLDYNLQLQTACASANQVARLVEAGSQEIASADGTPCLSARLLPAFPGKLLDKAFDPAANIVVLDPQSGEILALVSDPDLNQDPAHLPGHPAGTLLTPFVYLTGFTRGLSPASLIWDIAASIPEQAGEVANADGAFHGPLRLRSAFANDYLGPAVQVLAQVGPENAWRTTRQMGITTLEVGSVQAAYRLLQNEGEILLLEAVQAYGVFANQGLLVGRLPAGADPLQSLVPVTIRQVVDAAGNVWLDCGEGQMACSVVTRPVISTQLAYLINHILSDEPARWPSLGHPNPLEIGRPAGAKIGRTSAGNDAWTIGYTQQLVVGVWLGSAASDNRTYNLLPAAAGLWHAVFQYANRSLPVQEWVEPPGISSVEVCDPSGMLPTRDCPVLVQEVFLNGREPTFPDTLFRAFQINRESGNLATIFTPPELVDRRVYMMVPPQAAAWAQAANLPLIPESYDVFGAPEPPKANAQITTPAMFAGVNGEVAITGRAGGDGFSFYRVQIGQGLNPEQWLELGEDEHKPVWNNVLKRWNTTGLNGLYVIQLLVVREDQQVDSHTIQVTIDNQPPQIKIIYPAAEQQLRISADKTLTFQVDASDDLDLAEVIFYVDDRPLVTLTTPPFAAAWQARSGKHTLRVKAIDQAGNESQAEVEFEIER